MLNCELKKNPPKSGGEVSKNWKHPLLEVSGFPGRPANEGLGWLDLAPSESRSAAPLLPCTAPEVGPVRA